LFSHRGHRGGSKECRKTNGKQKRCIAHLDVLGFSNIVKGNSKKAWDILNKLYKLLLIIPERITVSSTRQNITNTVKSIFFSDTIILYTEQDNFEDLFSIFLTATNFFFQSML